MSKEEELVEDWCFEKNLENEGWLNSGENGNAYAISEDKVIKITRDYNEFIQTFNILEHDSDSLPKIYDMRVFPDGELGILMEYLDTSNIENLFNEIETEASLQELDIMDMDTSIGFLSKEARKFGKDIQNSFYHMQLHNIAHFDIQPDNIGLNSKGNYVLFDQTKKATSVYDEIHFKEVKNKLKERYEIDEPIFKEDIDLEKLSVNRHSLQKTLKDIGEGRYSHTKEPLTCMYNSYGKLQLVDGFHRFCEKLLQGEEVCNIEIEHDERTGYHSPVYAVTEPDDEFKIDNSATFGGLEDFADEDILNDYYEQYIKSINKIQNKRKLKL